MQNFNGIKIKFWKALTFIKWKCETSWRYEHLQICERLSFVNLSIKLVKENKNYLRH